MALIEQLLASRSTDQEAGRFRVALWFALASFVVITANALLFSYVVSAMAERGILQRDASLSAQYVNSTVRLVGASAYFQERAVDPKAPQMEAFFYQISGLPEVHGANVYGIDRSVLWSSDASQIGKRFKTNEALEAAFRGELHPKIETLNENALEEESEHVDFPAGMSKFIETYIPIWSDDGTKIVGAVEVYRSPAALLNDIAAVRHAIWLGSAAGAVVLFASLIAVVMAVRHILAEQERRIVATEKYAVVGELTSAVAHGLRNPLASIRSSAELALDGDSVDEVKEPIADIIAQSERLENWIRSFLMQTREIPGQHSAAVALDDIIRDCLQGFAPQAQARHIVLDFQPEGASPCVRINRAELSQVINSLIANSLEAIGSGGEVIVRRSESATGRVSLTIEDNGPGIAPEIASRLFQSCATSKAAGLGVGLSLTKRILDRCGGTIEIVNRKMQGARATLSLPSLGAHTK